MRLFGVEHFELTSRWPEQKDLLKWPVDKQIKLCMISYRTASANNKKGSLYQIQLHFTNGVVSTIFQGIKKDKKQSKDSELEKLKHVKVDYLRRIATVKMFVNDCYLQQLIFEDEKKGEIVNLGWYDPHKNGHWQEFEIPEGQEIIGLQCNTNEFYIHSLGFITWTPNRKAIPPWTKDEDERYKRWVKRSKNPCV